MHEHTLRKPAQWITAIDLDKDTDAKEHIRLEEYKYTELMSLTTSLSKS